MTSALMSSVVCRPNVLVAYWRNYGTVYGNGSADAMA